MILPHSSLDASPDDPVVTSLPKADLHLHQEWFARLDRVLAAREGRPSFDWRTWLERVTAENEPGMRRLSRLAQTQPASLADDTEENFIARVRDLLEEAAAQGAVLVEARFGREHILRPAFMELFREAERRTREQYPDLHAVAVATLVCSMGEDKLESVVQACLASARDGLGGIDLLYQPYDTEADWKPLYRLGARAADAGLGVTAHAGEASSANIAAALRTPGLTRLGHAVYAAEDDGLLQRVSESGVTIECCLTCNVAMGVAPSFEEHPIRRFVTKGIRVALGTDNPVQLGTTIGREYGIAAALGFTPGELMQFTHNAIEASFAPSAIRSYLLSELDVSIDN